MRELCDSCGFHFPEEYAETCDTCGATICPACDETACCATQHEADQLPLAA